jgi:hypothetical protein
MGRDQDEHPLRRRSAIRVSQSAPVNRQVLLIACGALWSFIVLLGVAFLAL